MDGKSDFDSIGDEEFGELSNSVLSLGNSHAVSWNNNDVFAVDEHPVSYTHLTLPTIYSV